MNVEVAFAVGFMLGVQVGLIVAWLIVRPR